MTMLSIVQNMCKRSGLAQPYSAIGSTDSQVSQMVGLLEEEVNDLAQRHTWTSLTRESTFSTVAGETQGAIDTLAPGFRFMKNDTLWDRTNGLPVIGPISGKDWQQNKAMAVNGPRFQYRFLGSNVIVNPAPAAGYIWAFEYCSKYAILDVDGVTLKEFFTADTDTIMLPESLITLGLRWRWKAEKGLSYAENFDSYEMQVKDAMGRDGGKRTLYADGECQVMSPGVFVPSGSWSV